MKATSSLVLFLLSSSASACTTIVASRAATSDGSVMVSHSNDGDGATVGNLRTVPSAAWSLPQERHVSGGSVPQVPHTFSYFTKVGGYASINEHQVALAESTCVAVFSGNRSAGAVLNIVDLSELGLERANSSRAAVLAMGRLAEVHGYYDAGESLLVADPHEAFIFHVLPDPSGTSAVWVAQRVPDRHVGVVANSFSVREVSVHEPHAFLYSTNLFAAASATGRWLAGPLDFTRVFAGPEPGHKYVSGRRMWRAYSLLAPVAAARLPETYPDYVGSRPYPATVPASNVSAAAIRRVMRDYYEGTPYDMGAGMAAGAFGSPARWSVPAGTVGAWERPIAIERTILSYVAVCQSNVSRPVGGLIWLAMHAAHTSVYVPFFVGLTMAAAQPVRLPPGYTTNQLRSVDRGVGAWQSAVISPASNNRCPRHTGAPDTRSPLPASCGLTPSAVPPSGSASSSMQPSSTLIARCHSYGGRRRSGRAGLRLSFTPPPQTTMLAQPTWPRLHGGVTSTRSARSARGGTSQTSCSWNTRIQLSPIQRGGSTRSTTAVGRRRRRARLRRRCRPASVLTISNASSFSVAKSRPSRTWCRRRPERAASLVPFVLPVTR